MTDYENKVRGMFDEESFKMFKDFSACASTVRPDREIKGEFVSPLVLNKDTGKIVSVIGITLEGDKKLGVQLHIDPVDIVPPIKQARAFIKRQMRKIKKALLKQLKES